jgi:hypothetical protein
MKVILVLLLLFSFSSLATGDAVYQWTDEHGVIHFTDDHTTVPKELRPDVEGRYMPTTEAETGSTTETEEEIEGILIEDDFKEKDEAWWRNWAEKWRRSLQASHEAYEKLRLRYNALANEFNASKDSERREEIKADLHQMRREMERFKADHEKAQRMLEVVLPSQARKAGKPIEWVHQVPSES